MKKIWYKIFPPNDWILIKSLYGVWNIHHDANDSYEFGRRWKWDAWEEKRYCFFKIEYSKYRNKTRITKEGHKPLEHPMYQAALETQSKLNLRILEDEQPTQDNKSAN